MSWTVRTLDLGLVELNRRRMVANTESPGTVRVPVQAWLLLGGPWPVVIDSGFRNPEILGRLGEGIRGLETTEQRLERQLALHGVAPRDVRYVVQTHLHIDHAGQTDIFPASTTVVVNRRELEYSVSGLSGPSYPPEDIKHLIDRLHTRGALRLLDVELSGGEAVVEGIRCSGAGSHTEGSMMVMVDTIDGPACFCGDLVYSVWYQLLSPALVEGDPGIIANTVLARRSEKASMKRMLNLAPRFRLYPSHDRPVTIEHARAVTDAAWEGDQGGGIWCRLVEADGPTAAGG